MGTSGLLPQLEEKETTANHFSELELLCTVYTYHCLYNIMLSVSLNTFIGHF